MSTLPDEKLIRWLERKLQPVSEDADVDDVTRVELWHQHASGSSEPVERWPRITEDTSASDLATEIWGRAEDDAEARPGNYQKYAVACFRGDSDEIDSQWPIVMRDKNQRTKPGDLSVDSDPANEQGLLAQLMRSNALMSGQLIDINLTMNQRLLKENDALAKRAEAADKRVMDAFLAQQDILDRKSERAIQEAEAAQRMRRVDQAIEFAMATVPLMVAKWAGLKPPSDGMPALGSSARDNAVMQFFKGLSPEELQGVMTSLSTEHRVLAFELYKSYAEDHAKSEAAKPEIMREQSAIQESDNLKH